MDLPTELETDELFFQQGENGTYEGGPAHAPSLKPVSLAAEEVAPLVTLEQAARADRFRKPVAWTMAGMGGLLLLALAVHRSPGESYASFTPAPSVSVALYSALPAPSTNAQSDEQASAVTLTAPLEINGADDPPPEQPDAHRAAAESAQPATAKSAAPSTTNASALKARRSSETAVPAKALPVRQASVAVQAPRAAVQARTPSAAEQAPRVSTAPTQTPLPSAGRFPDLKSK